MNTDESHTPSDPGKVRKGHLIIFGNSILRLGPISLFVKWEQEHFPLLRGC